MHATPAHSRIPREHDAVDPRMDEALRALVAIGAVLVLLLPAARGMHAAIGWLPLWLLGMPLAAWWALHRFRLPGWRQPAAQPAMPARALRRAPVQARRRKRIATGTRPARAA